MKVLFLDIDGVLTSFRVHTAERDKGMLRTFDHDEKKEDTYQVEIKSDSQTYLVLRPLKKIIVVFICSFYINKNMTMRLNNLINIVVPEPNMLPVNVA